MAGLEDPIWGITPKATPDFHIAVIYDSAHRAQQALKVCQRLINDFNREFLFHIALCDLSGFEAGDTPTPSMRDAAQARVLVIASNSTLTARCWDWMNHWAAARGKRLAVATLMDGFECASGVSGELDRLCRRHGIDFINGGQDQQSVAHAA